MKSKVGVCNINIYRSLFFINIFHSHYARVELKLWLLEIIISEYRTL